MTEREGFRSPQEREMQDGYLYHSSQEVSAALDGYGYGPSKKFVDSIWVDKENYKAVGVLLVTEDQCKDHFVDDQIFRGVDAGEAAGQTLLLMRHFIEGLGPKMKPVLKEIDFKAHSPAFPGTTLNIAVERTAFDRRIFEGRARIFAGEELLYEATGKALVVRSEVLKRILEDAREKQISASPRFPNLG